MRECVRVDEGRCQSGWRRVSKWMSEVVRVDEVGYQIG